MKLKLASLIILATIASSPVLAAETAESKPVEISKQQVRALKMSAEQAAKKEKVGTISSFATSIDDLDDKISAAAEMLGAKYYVYTSVRSDNRVYGTADLYK